MEKPSVAFDPLPNNLPLQGKRVLAAHPPSCHPRRVFGSRESERKGKKMGEKEKKRENWSLKIYSPPKSPLYSVWSGGFYSQPIKNYKNNIAKYYYNRGKKEKNRKSKEAKTGSRKEQGRMNSAQDSEQWQWQKHSCSAPFFFAFCSSFLLGFDLQQ